MAKFRKKPVVIEAEQWFSWKDGPTGGVNGICYELCGAIAVSKPHVHTLEGMMMVSEGDWIIVGVKGERYPCKPEIFALTYEAVE
jgi:hypothetical protein